MKKQILSEEVLKMQKRAGIITESKLKKATKNLDSDYSLFNEADYWKENVDTSKVFPVNSEDEPNINATPQSGKSSGAPAKFKPGSEPEKTEFLVLNQILQQIKGIPYYKEVLDDMKKGDESWEVTKKVKEYAEYMKKNPSSLGNLPPIIVIDGKIQDGAHRISAIYLLQNLLDPKNTFWKTIKLKVEFWNSKDQLNEAKKETLRTWFKRKGAPGKTGGWVDCNTCREVDSAKGSFGRN